MLATLPVVVALLAAATPAQAATPSDDTLGLGLGSVTSNVSVGLDAAYGIVSLSGVGALLDSSFTLADLDPVTGALVGTDVSTSATADYALSVDLSASSLMALDTAELSRRSQEQAAQARAKDSSSTGNSEVGPDGCPTTAPENTLRAGSATLGIYQLCVDSVEQAASPAAARAVKFELSNLGVPYSQPNRMQDGYFDCSSFAMRAYTAGGLDLLVNGWAPNTAAIRASSWAEPISLADAKPGDLVFPTAGHVAMVLADGYMSHTNRPGDVSHVKKLYTDVYGTYRVNPDKVS